MKEHFQDYGVRRWAGDNLIELQKEPLEAIQKLVEPYAPCILQGCEVNATEKRITPGMVALWELDENNRKKGVKIARFEGCVTQSFPVFLTLKRTTEERVYVDGKNKPVAYDYTAQNTTVENDVKDMFPLKITATGGPRLAESLTVNFTAATERNNIQPNETIGTVFGKIRKWFSDLKAHAFRAITKEDFAKDLQDELDGKAAGNHTHTPASLGAAATSHSHANATISTAGFMSAADKQKIESLFEFRIVGRYVFNENGGVSYQQNLNGYTIDSVKNSISNEACYKITLSGSSFDSNKSYFLIPVAGYKHSIELYGHTAHGKESFNFMYRNLNGVAEYSGFAPILYIMEFNE